MGAQDRFAQEGFHASRSLDGKLTTRLDEGRASYSPEAASRQGAGRRCLASPSCSAHGCSAPCLVLRNSATAGGSTDGRFYLNLTPAEIPQLGRHCWLTFLFLLLFYFFFFNCPLLHFLPKSGTGRGNAKNITRRASSWHFQGMATEGAGRGSSGG